LTVALVGLTAQGLALANQTISLVSGTNPARRLTGTTCGVPLRPVPFTAADYLAARTGPVANIIAPWSPPWIAALPHCPNARWISSNAQGIGVASSLYAVPFTVNDTCILQATLDICFAVDDGLGDFLWGGANPEGLYLTNSAFPGGVAIPASSGGNYGAETCWSFNVTGLVAPGQNWLYLYDRDAGCAVGGMVFCATVNIIAPNNGFITVCKFDDSNCDGIHDPGEAGMPGWTILATNDATGQVYSVTTGSSGCASFSGLPFGTYSITEVQQPGWKRTYPPCQEYTVTLDCQHSDLGPFVFGNCRCPQGGTLINLSTGVDDATGNLLPFGAPDDTWKLTCRPGAHSPLPPSLATAWVVPTIYWAPPTTGSQWISADPNGNAFYVLPQGDYCYEACFDLCGCTNPYLDLLIMEDDGGTVYLNGIQILPTGSPCASFTTPCHIVVANSPQLFRDGRNCITIVVANTPAFATPTGLDVYGFVESAHHCCGHDCPCTQPPTGMTGWWPLDETTGSIAKDIAGFPNNGTHSSAGLTLAVGEVNAARNFNGTDYITVPHHPHLNPTYGPFSIDAWIRLPAGGNGMIVSKAQYAGTPIPVGFDFYVNFSGLLTLALYDGASAEVFNYTGVSLDDGCWHHVAATVQRLNPQGVKLYVDGASQAFPTALAGSLGNSSVLRIGAPSYTLTGMIFAGLIDEVEFFRRVLTPVEVDRIFQAASEGKCRWHCYLPSATNFCLTATSVVVPVTVCNYSSVAQTYAISGSLLGVGGPCNVPGTGATITPAVSMLTVPPGGCGVRYFTITRPTGLNFAGATACYEFTVTNAAGEQHTCHGTLVDRREVCTNVHCPYCWPTLVLASGDLKTLSLEISDTDTPTGELPYQISVRDPETGEPLDAVRLNGLPPGIPVTGTLVLPPPGGGTATIDIELLALDLSSNDIYELVLEADLDGDGTFEPLYIIPVEGEFGPNPDAGACDDFDSYAADSQVAGQNGWQGWDNNNAAGALTSTTEAQSAPNSVAILGASDLVHPYTAASSGRWVLKAWQYVPSDFVSHCDGQGNCGSYFMLLNTYQDGGPYSWTVQLHADSVTSGFLRDDSPAASLPLIQGTWAEIKTVIDLDQDWFRVFYQGTELGTQGSWTGAFPGQTTAAVLNIGALDLYANQSTVVYYDDVCLTLVQPVLGDMNCDGVVDFDDINPFVLALSNPNAWQAAYPECYLLNGDCNGDGVVDFDDINPFVAILSGG
jgi:hypothetical protein